MYKYYALRFGKSVNPDLKNKILGKDLGHKFGLVTLGYDFPGKREFILTNNIMHMTSKEVIDVELKNYLTETLSGNYKLLNVTEELDKL